MSKTTIKALSGQKIEQVDLLDTGYVQLVLSNGMTVIVRLAAIIEGLEEVEEVEEAPTKAAKAKAEPKKSKKAPEPEPEEEEDDEEEYEEEGEEEEELDIEEVRQALIDAGYTKKELKGMDDDELIEAYEGLEEEDDEGEEEEDDDEDWDD